MAPISSWPWRPTWSWLEVDAAVVAGAPEVGDQGPGKVQGDCLALDGLAEHGERLPLFRKDALGVKDRDGLADQRLDLGGAPDFEIEHRQLGGGEGSVRIQIQIGEILF